MINRLGAKTNEYVSGDSSGHNDTCQVIKTIFSQVAETCPDCVASTCDVHAREG